MPRVPNIRFLIDEHVNLYYHVCVLFSEYSTDEYSLGILNNSAYRQQYENLKTRSLHKKFQELWRHSYYAWDFVGKSLHEANTLASARNILERESRKQMDIWLGILSESHPLYQDLWSQTETKLKKYKAEFEAEWNLVGQSILTKMSNIARLPWKTDSINVHLVDCVHGASSWTEDIVLPPFPDVDVEKKLLSHEVAHTLMPDYFLRTKLQSYGLGYATSHTIVDLTAYFAVKEYVTDPERRGIKPNPNYYAEVPTLYPIFEDCYTNPDRYQSFDDILRRIKL